MNRTKFAGSALAALFIFLALSLFNLQLLQGGKYRSLSDRNCIRLLPQWGARGNILDRNGELVVGNEMSYDVMVLAEDADQQNRALAAAARLLQKPPAALLKTYRANYIGPSLPVLIQPNVERKIAIAFEELKNDIPGLVVQSRPGRAYPYGNLACHLIGYLAQIDRWRLTKLEDYGYKTKDIVGFGGVEEKYDYYLRQEEGGLSFEVDHRGKFVRALGFKPPVNGKDIQLSLDLRVQKIAEEKLNGRNGCVVILDPWTGEVITMASSPGFDPAALGQNVTSLVRAILNDPASPLINRAISAAYPPGSVFKPVVAAAALENKKINLATSFFCQGSTLVGSQRFRCWDTHGQQNIVGALAHSCDIFFYKTGLLLQAQPIHDYAVKFGLNRTSEVDLPYEASGFMPSPLWRKINKFKNWYPGDTANMSIGQGESLTTPIQIARMMAVFANKGYLVRPYVVKAVGGYDISAEQRKITHLKLKESTISYIRQGLRDTIRDPKGTANPLSSLAVSCAGKTGTAQAPPGRPHAWFCGFFPFTEPEYVICVFLERGNSGSVAVAVAKQIIEAMYAMGDS